MMKRSILKFAVVICASLALLTACEYDVVVPEKYVPPPIDTTVVISFAQDIQPIFNAKCISCHPSVFRPDLSAANSYNSLISGNYVVAGDPANSKLYNKCKPGGTMENYCSSEELTLISGWIYAGAENN
jgi:hypothetical protein